MPHLSLLQRKCRAPLHNLLCDPSRKFAADVRVIPQGLLSPERQVFSSYSHRHPGHGMTTDRLMCSTGDRKDMKKWGEGMGSEGQAGSLEPREEVGILF